MGEQAALRVEERDERAEHRVAALRAARGAAGEVVDEELDARLVAAALAQPPPPELGAREDAVRRDEQVEHAAQLAPARAAVEVARRALGARRAAANSAASASSATAPSSPLESSSGWP